MTHAPGTIAGYSTTEDHFEHGGVSVSYVRVPRLEDLVDREALLREDAVPEPPYWAHLWIGAFALARFVIDRLGEGALRHGSVLDLGCGLGLTGLVAARLGADVWFADSEEAPLRFVRESLRRGHLAGHVERVDFVRDDMDRRFDVILGAEIVYAPEAYGPLADFLDRHLAPEGILLLTDAFRSDATTFFERLRGLGFDGERHGVHEWEAGRPQGLFIWSLRRGQ